MGPHFFASYSSWFSPPHSFVPLSAMASTLTKSNSIPSSTPSAQTTPVSAGDIHSIPSQIVWMPNPDTSILAQLIASEASYQRTNQVLFGTNITILLMAALFVAYRVFKKVKSRTASAKSVTGESWSHNNLRPTVGARVADDRPHNAVQVSQNVSPRSLSIGLVSEETLTSPSSISSRIPLRGLHSPKWRSRFFSGVGWVWHSRGGRRSSEGFEESRTLPTLKDLSNSVSNRWYRVLEQGRSMFASVSVFPTRTSTQSNSNMGVDRRARERSLPIPNSARTTTFSTNSSVPTLPPYRHSLERADESMSPTPSSPSACCHDRRLRESTFLPIPALPDISSMTALPLPPPLRAAEGREISTMNFPHSDSRRSRARERSLPALPRLSVTPVLSDITVSAE
ncbi:hypothetical protein BDN71DRAFT_1064973 [Pleurotus eryngii]|uniref:Uncharacterized protein n=1 Tax=Pleurotus eryngii TaxID=5323 RepID=A0A9P5ZSX2_PLEER|nr:hypothetical protein BDN71DRAFT_1064973 [Pleurotus eryngii]